ncbi:unnamed protein product [Tetraodon nigroviridis]|uniref:(spotted green pufferfish) hypothetical protein n=1 Tax=Tetraodon nigroviridis TaxID=99883 RepID=Q4SW14_TETNG|nr:unnamed protein product [Tetraodon nigroviridis]
MATKFSELELAIHTLVSEFHKAAEGGASMNTTQFQTMMSKQLPVVAKTQDNEEGLGRLLQQMGVQNGQNVSFENFWVLINKQAVQVFGSTHKEKNIKCGCLPQ